MRRFIITLFIIGITFSLTAFQCSSTELTSAKLYIQQENMEKAKEALIKEVQANPKSDEGYYLLGFVYGKEGEIENMIENFDKSLAISDKWKQDIVIAKKSYWADSFNKGVGYFNKASKAGTEDSTNMYYDKAVESFEQGVMLEPDSVSTYKNLAFALINLQKQEEAIEPLEKIIKLDPSPDTYTMLGDIYVNQGEKLMNTYKVTKMADDSVKAAAKYESAIALLEKGRKEFPDNSQVLLLLSNAYIKADKMDVAMDAFKEGVEQEPTNQYYKYNYGVLLLQAKDYEGAVNQFKGALDIDPAYTNAIYNLAVTYVRWGTTIREEEEAKGEDITDAYKEKFELALPNLEAYLVSNPEDASVWELLGKVYGNLGNNEKSMEAFEKADQLRP
ncbi:MAG: tetratricopeptide repeat protein [Ignavibacteriae bacterium]|nr:tetratricopeptide repeat protein [Ignavibacteriota bacterium]NOG96655.1 tetratricopeptide repeat protein [Ignavibacteriota bacterium]